MTRSALPVCLGLLALASPLAAQEKPASPAQIAEAVSACREITSPTWIDLKELPSLGWSPYTKASGRNQMKIGGAYEKAGNQAILVIGHEELKAKTCVVLAKLESGAAYGATAQGVAGIIGMPTRQSDYTYIWEREGQHITLDPSGDKSAPKARFAINAIKESAE